jgi:outer membrane protein assembly factor BamB
MNPTRGLLAGFSLLVVASGAHGQAPAPPPIYGGVAPFPPIAAEWYAYRHNGLRTGAQPYASDLSNPAKVGTLAVKWGFPATGPGVGRFRASPIIVDDTVFVGSESGHFFALDAATGALKWQYPKPGDPPLYPPVPNPSGQWNYGIQSSASYWYRGPKEDGGVIFGAQDPSLGPHGSARLFALNAKTGAVIWKSDPIAVINGTTPTSTTELHERIGFSSPLVLGDKAYIGIANNGDNPIQKGRVVAVDLATGHIDAGFHFRSVGTAASPPDTRGGGVWNSPASDGAGVYFTTGNTREDAAGVQMPEPKPNHGLSMIRVNKVTGDLIWAFQPVPYHLDDDPDWAAGVTIMRTSCGELIASVQKDGWAYAVEAGNGTPGVLNVKWQFPATGFPFTQYTHGDDNYKRPGAAWNDVLIINTGGESLVHDGVVPGYTKLHALNACARDPKQFVRWIADIPNTVGGYAMGAPTVTGGIVFVGTNQGHLIVLADPSVVPPTGWRCSNIDYTTAATCTAAGYVLVPVPKVLANVAMPDGGNIAGMRNEVALAKGRAFVATGNGHVYMLAP